MIQVPITAEVRKETGKGVARKLRQNARIPAILYGQGLDPVPLSVDEREFNRVVFRAGGEQVIFTVKMDGNGEGEQLAVVKEVQRHPVSDRIRHIDFLAISAKEEVKVEVPVKIVGKAKGVEFQGGVLEILERTLTISCLPFDIPKEIEIDISELEVGDAIHVGSLTPPKEGIQFVDPADTTIVTVVGGAVEEVAEEGEELETVAEGAGEETADTEE